LVPVISPNPFASFFHFTYLLSIYLSIYLSVYLLIYLDTGSHYVSQAGLKLTILLPLPLSAGIIDKDTMPSFFPFLLFILMVLGFELRACACWTGALSLGPHFQFFLLKVIFQTGSGVKSSPR
jgi:hypothetical protein